LIKKRSGARGRRSIAARLRCRARRKRKRCIACASRRRRAQNAPNLGLAKVGAALVGLSALVLQVLGGDAGDTTLKDRGDTEAGAADLRGGGGMRRRVKVGFE
jgi:hypothetical protein